MRSAQHIASKAVSTVCRIIHRIKLRETRVVAAIVGIVRQGKVRETVGIENEVAGDGSASCDLAVTVHVAPVNGREDCGQSPGVEHAYRRDHGGVRKIRIARARGSWVCGVNVPS